MQDGEHFKLGKMQNNSGTNNYFGGRLFEENCFWVKCKDIGSRCLTHLERFQNSYRRHSWNEDHNKGALKYRILLGKVTRTGTDNWGGNTNNDCLDDLSLHHGDGGKLQDVSWVNQRNHGISSHKSSQDKERNLW